LINLFAGNIEQWRLCGDKICGAVFNQLGYDLSQAPYFVLQEDHADQSLLFNLLFA
jgi:hypothetical protein